jgi:hypothetical protein
VDPPLECDSVTIKLDSDCLNGDKTSHVVSSSDDPEALPAYEMNAEMMELDDFQQRYSALAMQVK